VVSKIRQLEDKLLAAGNDRVASFLQKYFQTKQGVYAEGDTYIGVRVPMVKKLCRQYRDVPLEDIEQLLQSHIHEFRLAGAILLSCRAEKACISELETIYHAYLRHRVSFNNWDLIAVSAPNIIGRFLLKRDRDILYDLATSDRVWDRWIAIMSTRWFMRKGEMDETFKLAELLLEDKHPLIHQAVGWILHEAGRYDPQLFRGFIDRYGEIMPRRMLQAATM
jgi:3-methyladenine DNA glycosylase AlkD